MMRRFCFALAATGAHKRPAARRALLATSAFCSVFAPTQSFAALDFSVMSLERINETQGVVGVSAFVALVLFSTSTALLHLTGRKRWTQRETSLVSDLAKARAALD